MDYEALNFWLDVLQMASTLVLAIWVWIATRHRVTTDRLDELEDHVQKQVGTHDIRLTRVEEQIAALPTHTDIGGVFKRIDEIHGDLREIAGRIEGIDGAVKLMNKFLLEHGK